jgi:hypothetical protein
MKKLYEVKTFSSIYTNKKECFFLTLEGKMKVEVTKKQFMHVNCKDLVSLISVETENSKSILTVDRIFKNMENNTDTINNKIKEKKIKYNNLILE